MSKGKGDQIRASVSYYDDQYPLRCLLEDLQSLGNSDVPLVCYSGNADALK